MPRTLISTSSYSGVEQGISTKRGEIDGLRAIAVLLVLLYHAKFGFAGGYVGVDVFFVISGFLVTSLLLREIDLNNHIALGLFWGRRIRRLILPVSLVTVATVAVGYLTLEPFRLRSLAYDALSAATMNPNNRFALTTSDYLSGLALPSPLQHLWSLVLRNNFI
jgi:peptidoglycan/LPS O-acetylase OafA/YrhL